MKRIIGIAVVLLVCLLNACGFAGEESASIEVVASGVGRDSDSALKNAFKAAVQQALGSIVDSKVMVENDEVVSDKILSHSGGYVTEYEMLGEPKTEDDLVTVRIKAQVERRQLMASAASEGLILQEDTSEPFDIKAKVNSITAKTYTTAQDNRSAGEMIREQLAGYPENFLKIRYVDSEPGEKEGEFFVRVETSCDPEKLSAFHADLRELMDRVADSPGADVRYTMEPVNWNIGSGRRLNKSGSRGFSVDGKNTFSVPVRTNSERTLGSWRRYEISKELDSAIREILNSKKLFTRIVLQDASGASLRDEPFTVPIPILCYNNYRHIVLYDVLTQNNHDTDLIPGENPAVLRYALKDLFPEEVAAISSVKVTLEKR